MPDQAVAHAAPGRVAHLAVLQMEPRIGEAIEIAGVVVMQMGDDDVADRIALTPNPSSASTGLSVSLRRAGLGLFGVEAGIDQDFAAVAPDQPDEVVEVLRRGLVRVRHQEIQMRGARRHRRIAQRVDFVGVSHRCHFSFAVCDWPMSAPSHCHPQRSNRRPVWQPHDGRRTSVRPVTLPGCGPQSRNRQTAAQAATAGAIYSPSFAPPRRGELSQLMTTSQAVDGLRGSFDNAVCVE